MKRLLKKLFTNETDLLANHIIKEDISKPLRETAKQGKDLAKLLGKNGVTLQIYVSAGGDRNEH